MKSTNLTQECTKFIARFIGVFRNIFLWGGDLFTYFSKFKHTKMFTLVMGPDVLGLREPCPETELLGLSVFCCWDVLGLNDVILCDTPGARVNCSLNSTLVRPLAKKKFGKR